MGRDYANKVLPQFPFWCTRKRVGSCVHYTKSSIHFFQQCAWLTKEKDTCGMCSFFLGSFKDTCLEIGPRTAMCVLFDPIPMKNKRWMKIWDLQHGSRNLWFPFQDLTLALMNNMWGIAGVQWCSMTSNPHLDPTPSFNGPHHPSTRYSCIVSFYLA